MITIQVGIHAKSLTVDLTSRTYDSTFTLDTRFIASGVTRGSATTTVTSIRAEIDTSALTLSHRIWASR
jgi:hypothetical protein